jgi:hemolysin III
MIKISEYSLNPIESEHEPNSVRSHLLGVILSVIGLAVLLMAGRNQGLPGIYILSFMTYGITQILLYLMSTIYHSYDRGTVKKALFKKFDHIMIFWYIAGTFTPICVIAVGDGVGMWVLALVWLVTLFGTVFKAMWAHSPGYVNAILYIGMGWLAVFLLRALWINAGLNALLLVVAGGISYTTGAIIYARSKKKDLAVSIHMHDIFHWFILVGSAFFYAVIYCMVLPMAVNSGA